MKSKRKNWINRLDRKNPFLLVEEKKAKLQIEKKNRFQHFKATLLSVDLRIFKHTIQSPWKNQHKELLTGPSRERGLKEKASGLYCVASSPQTKAKSEVF